MIKTEEATEIILGNVRSLPGQRVELLSSLNRVLAEDIYSSLNLPPFDNSAMDGYALIASDTKGSSPASPKILEVVEDLPAGKIATRRVGNGGAVRIMTGAPIPRGADAVIMVENTQSQDSRVLIFQEVRKFENIRKAGEDTRKGVLIMGAGTANQARKTASIWLDRRYSCVRSSRQPRLVYGLFRTICQTGFAQDVRKTPAGKRGS